MDSELVKLFYDQLSCWDMARDNYRALKEVETRTVDIDGFPVLVQYNPARAISTKANTDPDFIDRRSCFLCADFRPPQQLHMEYEGTKEKKYVIQVNPFPVFQQHFVIPAVEHTPQRIAQRYADMLRFCRRYPGFTFLYNGPKSGASAPDHFHYQAFPAGQLPLENQVRSGKDMTYITSVQDARLYHFTAFARGIFVIVSDTPKSAAKMFYRLLDCADIPDGDTEPRFNLFTFLNEDRFCSIVVFRSRHRSSHYYSPYPETHLTMSPGCVDMGGVMITVEHDDFVKLSPELLRNMLEEITVTSEEEVRIMNRLTRVQPTVDVLIKKGKTIDFEVMSDGAQVRRASLSDGRILYDGILYDMLYFEAMTPSTMFAEPSFVIHGSEPVPYAGTLKIAADSEYLYVINRIGVEDCLANILANGRDVSEDDAVRLRTNLDSLAREGRKMCEIQGYSGYGQSTAARSVVDRTWGETL